MLGAPHGDPLCGRHGHWLLIYFIFIIYACISEFQNVINFQINSGAPSIVLSVPLSL